MIHSKGLLCPALSDLEQRCGLLRGTLMSADLWNHESSGGRCHSVFFPNISLIKLDFPQPLIKLI